MINAAELVAAHEAQVAKETGTAPSAPPVLPPQGYARAPVANGPQQTGARPATITRTTR